MGAQLEGRDVAVIVVNYNSGEYLADCLAALERQTVAPGKILVVDNASSDDSLIRGLAGRPTIRSEQMGYNAGFAAANNRGLELCREYPWVALLNPDAFAEPRWLEQMLAAADPRVGAVACRMRQADDTRVLDGTGDVYHVSGLAWRRHHGCPAASAETARQPVFAPCAAAALYNRRAVIEAGGFDEDYFCYFEDVDLGFRLRLLGFTCAYNADAVVRHVGSGITGRDSDFTVYHGHRNLVWTFVKNMPGTLFWRYLPQHLLLNLVSIVYYALKGRGAPLCRAKWHALRGLPSAWRKRAFVQQQCRVDARQVREFMLGGWLTPYRDRQVG